MSNNLNFKEETQMVSDTDSSSSSLPQNIDLTDLERSFENVEDVEVSSRLSRTVSKALSTQYGYPITNDELKLDKYKTIGMNKPFPNLFPEKEPYTVSFEGIDDPLHPHNWPMKRKLIICAVLGFNTAVVAFGSSIYSPVISEISKKYNVSTIVGSLGVSLYVLGFATGPVVWAPMSELYGRKIILILSMFGFTLFQYSCATAQDLQTILITRAFSGIFGSACLVVVPASFSDVFNDSERGIAIPIFTMNVFSMPLLSPIIGGFISISYLSWRWVEYITGFLSSLGLILLLFTHETNHQLILVQKAQNIRQDTGNWLIHAAHEEFQLSLRDVVEKTLTRPLIMLVKEPIILFISIYTAFIYGILYMLLSAFPIIYAEGYGMKGGVVYLPYIALVLGMMLGGVWCVYQNKNYLKAVQKNGGKPVPEARLYPVFLGSIAFPVGLLWFTWTGSYPQKIHWMVPTSSGIFIGFGLLSIFNATIGYIIDSYLIFAASALAANTFLRSGAACAFPLFSSIMFKKMGINWAGLMLGSIGIVLIPVPWLFFKYGKKIRTKSKYAFDL